MPADPEAARDSLPTWGKSASLRWFSSRLESARVPPFVAIAERDWRMGPGASLAECGVRFGPARLAVRSDAALEDGPFASHAGRFRTLLDVEHSQLRGAVEQVLACLPGDVGDGVFVQPMVGAVRYSAVAATHRVHDGAPWYCIDLALDDCAAVTGGRASGRQFAIARSSVRQVPIAQLALPPPVAAVLATLVEVESLSGSVPVEIELVLTDGAADKYHSHLLQVRRIAPTARWPRNSSPTSLPSLQRLGARDALPPVVGRSTVLSLMSDWNPAELLGTHPRPLALSLFQFLIGRGVWWRARSLLGYRHAPHPRVALLSPVKGRPYVDVRRSANSLLPSGLRPDLQARIVDCWVERVRASPELHDKVEFAVYRTARDFTDARALRSRWDDTLGVTGASAWESALGEVTSGLMKSVGARTLRAGALEGLLAADTSKANWRDLLQTCRKGTLEFAMLARIAFVAEAQLRSAIERGALSAERAQALRAASRPVQSLLGGGRPEANPPSDHLRPGTFEITQATWADLPRMPCPRHRIPGAIHRLDDAERGALSVLLREAGLPLDADSWARFVSHAIHAREWGKFVFTRHLSAALEDIGGQANRVGLDRECASWLSLAQLARGRSLGVLARARYWREAAARATARHDRESRILLSPVLREWLDRHVADSLGVLPNFVGGQVVRARVVTLDPASLPDLAIEGAIVAVRNADPGYDWVFGCGIAGLITAWGGANSHMAIRCAEFGLTAAIGCGEAVFLQASTAQFARIDPLGGALWLD